MAPKEAAPLLAALAAKEQLCVRQVEIGLIESDQFCGTAAGRVEGLKDGAVADGVGSRV